MKENLFKQLNDNLKIKSENIYFPDPNNSVEIEKVIEELDRVNICFSGVGVNGPVGGNLITTDGFRKLKTRILNASRDTIVINSLKYTGHTKFIPRRCVTIGIAEIFMAKELRFYLKYNWQSSVLRKAIFEKPTPFFSSNVSKRA